MNIYKIHRQELKKILLSLIVLGAMLYSYFTLLLGPLDRAEGAAGEKIKSLAAQIAETKQQLHRTTELETQSGGKIEAFDKFNSVTGLGAPLAWFPPRMTELFKRYGAEKVTARLINELPEKQLTRFDRLVWSIDIPRIEFASLGAAIASLENSEPLLRIVAVSIDAGDQTDPQFQHAMLSVETLVRQ